jgi:hypothetical protein
MKRPIAIAIIIGLPLGYFGRGALQPKVDRVATAMVMFDSYCAPFSQQEKVAIPADLVALPNIPTTRLWAEPQSRIMLEINSFSCAISDSLAHFSPQERTAFEAAVRAYTPTKFPMLEAEPSLLTDSWDLHALWSQYSRKELRHWSISLSRYQAQGPDSSTAFTAYAPAG